MKKIQLFTVILLFAVSIQVTASTRASRVQTRKAGDYAQLAVPAIAVGATLWHKDEEGAKQLLIGFAATQVSVHAFKYAFPVARRENPNNKKSSISGHTAVPMACAAYLQQRYGWKIAAPAYALTAFVGYSRVYSRAHRLNEVIGGAVLGQVIGYLITTPFKNDKLTVAAHPTGLNLVYTF